MPDIRVLLLEDSPAVSERMQHVLSEWKEARWVSCYSTVSGAMAHIREQPVDLLIADLKLPDGSGIDVIRFIHQQQPDAQAVVLSALSDRNTVVKAIQAGAAGYILKDDDQLDIIHACQSILAGHSPMSTSIARKIIEVIQSESGEDEVVEVEVNPLTPRENEVLSIISKGYTYRETAKLLDISEQTIPVHIRNIYRKLEVSNRTEAVFEARRSGLIR